jgi:hypothetical protein
MWISVLVSVIAAGFATFMWQRWRRLQRIEYIRSYRFPPGLFAQLAKHRPALGVKEQQLVARALRQFFLAYLRADRQRVAMPSQVVDELWHEFILYTRNYELFCQRAFGGFLHHTPAVVLSNVRENNEGLRRVWWYSCLEENINPRAATRLPLLFAIDKKLGIRDGFFYELDCRRAHSGDSGSVQCASHMSDSSIDGGTDGLGPDSSSDSGSDGGCSGGCGGGGD